MNLNLKNHLIKCRCCLNPLRSQRKGIKLNKRFQDNFLQCVGIELEESPCFSSFVCDVCKDEIDYMVTSRETFRRNQKILHKYVKGKDEVFVTLILKEEPEYEETMMDPFEVVETSLQNISVKVENFVDEYCVVEDKFSPVKVDESDLSSFQLKPCYVNLKRLSFPDTDNKSSSPEITLNENSPEETDKLLEEVEDSPSKIVCKKCGAVMDNKLQYANHLKEHKVGRGRGTDDFDEDIAKPCPFCGKMLKPDARAKHYKGHENEINDVNFICDHCDYKTPAKRNINFHMQRHVNIRKQNVIKCRFCPKKFLRWPDRRKHEHETHPEMVAKTDKREHKCQFCDKTFNNASTMIWHRKSKHFSGKFPCKNCGKIFATETALKDHWRHRHGPKKTCEICGVMTTRLSLHKKNSHNHIVCGVEGCGKEFKSQGMYRTHRILKHTKSTEEITCKYCGKTFDNKIKISRHIYQTHKIKYECEVPGCGYTTPRRAYLKLHFRSHKGIDDPEKARLLRELDMKAKFTSKGIEN